MGEAKKTSRKELGGWISVEDRLPRNEEEILVFGRPHGWIDPDIFLACRDYLDWKIGPVNDDRNGDEYLAEVTHWMRCPKPPNIPE